MMQVLQEDPNKVTALHLALDLHRGRMSAAKDILESARLFYDYLKPNLAGSGYGYVDTRPVTSPFPPHVMGGPNNAYMGGQEAQVSNSY